ncbi:hypothetical protein, partial [Viscerimonas tarda]
MIDRILLNNFLLFIISLIFTFLLRRFPPRSGNTVHYAPGLRIAPGPAAAFYSAVPLPAMGLSQ